MKGRNLSKRTIENHPSMLRGALSVLCVLLVLSSLSLVEPHEVGPENQEGKPAPALVPGVRPHGTDDSFREDPLGRSDWFYSQRAYPFDDIPADARRLAVEQLRAPGLVISSTPAATDRWQPVGPLPTLSAFPMNWGPTSGRINAVAVSPANSQVILAGAATGGIWRSSNGGNSFTPVADNQADIAVGSIAYSRSNPSTVYAGMGDTKLGYLGSGVLKSTDDGRSWRKINNNTLPSLGTVSKIDVDPLNSNRVYVAQYSRLADERVASSGFYVSNDGGVSWTKTIGGSPRDFVIDPSNRQTIYHGMIQANDADQQDSPAAGLYRSTNAGNSWSNLLTFTFNPAARRDVKVAVTSSSPQTIYVYSGGFLNGIGFRVSLIASTDQGATWSTRNTRDLDIGQFGYNTYIAPHPRDSNTIFVGARDVFKSTDGGGSWVNLNRNFTDSGDFLQYSPGLSNTHPDQHSLAFSPNNPDIIFIANDGGLSRSNDGGETFHSLNSTLSLTQFTGITIHPVDPALSFGGTQDNGTQRRLSGSSQWFEFASGDGGRAVVNPLGPGTVYTTFVQGAIFRFYEQGQIFDRQITFNSTFGEPDGSSRIGFYPPFYGNGVDSTLYFGTWRLFISTDTGETWEAPGGETELTKGFTRHGPDFLTAIGVGTSNLDVIYTGSAQGRAMLSRDRGRTWTDITRGLPDRFITSIAVAPPDSNIAYLTVSGFRTGHVFKTTDGGANWTDISGSLPDIPGNDLLIDPANPNRLYLGTDVGVFRSTSAGASWHALSDGMPPVIVSALAAHPSGIIQAATYGRGAYELSTAVDRPVINGVEYDGKKRVTIRGSLFGTLPRVLINDLDLSSRIKSSSEALIKIKAKVSVLGLRPGDNSVQVLGADGTSSNRFILRL